MKIAVIQRFLPSRSPGGAGHFTHGLCNALVRRQHQVTVFSHDPAPEDALYRVITYPVSDFVKRTKLQPLIFPFQIAKQIFSSFDLIHAQGDDQLIGGAEQPPVIRTIHASSLWDAIHNGLGYASPKWFFMYLYIYFWEWISCLRSQAVTAVSKEITRHYPRVDFVIPNGIDANFFSPRGLKSKMPSILFVGDLYTRKRGWLVRKVFQEEIRPSMPEARLWLACPEKVEEEGVQWLGYVKAPELSELYPQAWVFCLPSSSEGFGRPYVEAMASGTPVVATPNPGARDILEDGKYGLLVPDEKLGETLKMLLSHEDLRRQYCERGLERARVYDWDHVVKAYEEVYQTVLNRKGSRPVKKILYLQSTSEISGTDMTLLRILQRLRYEKFEPHVVLHKEGPFAEAYRKAGARVHIVPLMRKLTRRKGAGYLLRFVAGYLPAVLEIRKIIRREKIHLVHTNTIHNLYGFLAAKFSGVPHVWHVREIVVQSRLMRILEARFVAWFSDRFIVMDNAIAESFLGKKGGFPSSMVKLYDGVDLEEFHPRISGQRIRKELGIPENAPFIGTVCRLDPWKGVDIFLEAARIIHRAMPETHFLVCGGEIEGHPGYEARLKQKAASLGIADFVFFTGWHYHGPDIPEVYRALDISVQCPVYPEPYGLANVEAMACGVPIVASREGGPAELCVPGETALLVPAGKPEEVAGAVLILLKDPGLRQRMGEAGWKRAEQFFDSRRLVRELEHLYEEILSQG